MHMARMLVAIIGFAVVLGLASNACTNQTSAPNANGPKTLSAAATPNASPLSPAIPGDANFSDNPSTIQQIQHDFDVFSWQSFVALNWPLDQRDRKSTRLNSSHSQISYAAF